MKVIGTLPITFAPGVKDELGTELGRCSVQRYGVYVKRLPVLLFLLFSATTIGAQTYQPTWDSIDQRPTPEWFAEARLASLFTEEPILFQPMLRSSPAS